MPIYLSTSTPASYNVGATAVSAIYLGSAQVYAAASAGKIYISRSNGASTFTGNGQTSGTAYTRAAGLYLDETDGLSRYSWTATASGTIVVKFDYSDDSDSGNVARIYKNGSSLYTGLGSATNITRSFSIVSGDTVTIGASTADTGTHYFSNVSVYAT